MDGALVSTCPALGTSPYLGLGRIQIPVLPGEAQAPRGQQAKAWLLAPEEGGLASWQPVFQGANPGLGTREVSWIEGVGKSEPLCLAPPQPPTGARNQVVIGPASLSMGMSHVRSPLLPLPGSTRLFPTYRLPLNKGF